MAEPTQRLPENVVGRYFVDQTCIDCDLCRETAPDNFARNNNKGYSYVKAQPRGAAEVAACSTALEECPVEAIGILAID